jgi:hypothetical protein
MSRKLNRKDRKEQVKQLVTNFNNLNLTANTVSVVKTET